MIALLHDIEGRLPEPKGSYGRRHLTRMSKRPVRMTHSSLRYFTRAPLGVQDGRGACQRLSPSRDEPIPMGKDLRSLIAQAVRGKPTSDVRGAPTSLSGDGPGWLHISTQGALTRPIRVIPSRASRLSPTTRCLSGCRCQLGRCQPFMASKHRRMRRELCDKEILENA